VTRRLYTPELANKSLPLVARIAADIRRVANELRAEFQKLPAAADEDSVPDRIVALRDEFEALLGELDQLGVELKDPMTGLLDFRALRDGQEVYLCWRLEEPEVGHWHELAAGFAGRRPIADF
jgi:hypothetical protein